MCNQSMTLSVMSSLANELSERANVILGLQSEGSQPPAIHSREVQAPVLFRW